MISPPPPNPNAFVKVLNHLDYCLQFTFLEERDKYHESNLTTEIYLEMKTLHYVSSAYFLCTCLHSKTHRPGFLISDTIDIHEPGVVFGWRSVLCGGRDLATSVASIY